MSGVLPAHGAWTFLLTALCCPVCRRQAWREDAARGRVVCAACQTAHRVRDGVLVLSLDDEHPEVQQERASVPATEHDPALGGWATEGYAPATDPASPLGRAYLSLPHGDGSAHFAQPGYFRAVQRFAPEFDFIVRHLPHQGRLLDVGADGTWSTAALARRGLTGVALDITDHLALARLFQTACPPYALINVDMHAPVWMPGAFDVVTAFNALHHSTRLDALAANLSRALRDGGTLAFVEPYVQNAQQEAAFGAPQSAAGINENVHRAERWLDAFAAAGLTLRAYTFTDSFNAVFTKGVVEGSDDHRWEMGAPGEAFDRLGDFYAARLSAAPGPVRARPGEAFAIEVRVESLGRAAWSSRGPQPVNLAFHTTRRDGETQTVVAYDSARTPLPAFAAPGTPQTVAVTVTLAEPGEYDLEFDLVHEGRYWFGERGARTATVQVKVQEPGTRNQRRDERNQALGLGPEVGRRRPPAPANRRLWAPGPWFLVPGSWFPVPD